MSQQAITALFNTLAKICKNEPRPEALETANLIETADPQIFAQHCHTDFDAEIRATLAQTNSPITQAILAAQTHIPWDSNPVEGQGGISTSFFSVATLMGPEGPIFAPNLRMGLFYQRANTYYPLHNHDADETYTILAGSVIWTAGDDTRLRPAGDAIHHPSLMPHAFRTENTGFVALWRWSGDINTHSYKFLETVTD